MSPALIALLLNAVPPIILAVERAFATKDKSGPEKKQAVIRSVGQIAEAMLTAQVPLPDGTLVQEKSVSDGELGAMVETEYQRLKATGKLTESPSAGLGLFILRGTIVPIPSL